MKLSFATLGCPDWSIDTVISQAKAMGFHGVELRGANGNHLGPDDTQATRADIKAKFAAAKLQIAAISGYTNFATPEAEAREANMKRAIDYVNLSADVGCKVLRIFGGDFGTEDRATAVRRAAEGMKVVAEHAQKKGVTLSLETHDAWGRSADLLALLAAVNNPALTICWDVANIFWLEPMKDFHRAMKDRITHIHLKDVRLSPEGKHQNVLPGKGEVDLQGAVELLHRSGYNGFLSFEWEKKWDPKLEEPEIALPEYVRVVRGIASRLNVQLG